MRCCVTGKRIVRGRGGEPNFTSYHAAHIFPLGQADYVRMSPERREFPSVLIQPLTPQLVLQTRL